LLIQLPPSVNVTIGPVPSHRAILYDIQGTMTLSRM